MASKDPEELFNTETEEETVAMRKKRLRRVSFADREITSVHIFNRDEDYETPPEDSGRKPSSEEDDRQVLGFFRDLVADSDDSKEMSPDDDGEVDSRKSFLHPVESSSPGSSVIGSATSNDEDNFFGPVSGRFIRAGRLSDSAASDDNPDITLDSTTFSMHFRSLVRSELGDLKTATGTNFAFEEKTPITVANSSDSGSFMVLTKAKKPIGLSPLAVGKVSGGRDSNDMSLVGDDPHRYDYGRLSPGLEALLAETGESVQVDSLFDSASYAKSSKKSEVSKPNENGSVSSGKKENRDSDKCNDGTDDVYADRAPVAPSLGESIGGSTAALINRITHTCPSRRFEDLVADAHVSDHVQSPNPPDSVKKNPFMESVNGTSMTNIGIPVGSCENSPYAVGNGSNLLGSYSQHKPADLSSPQNLLKENLPADEKNNSLTVQLSDHHLGSPLAGSVTALSVKQEQTFHDTTSTPRHLSYVTPSPSQPSSFFMKENTKVGENVLFIQKSHSKFEITGSSAGTFARTSALRDKIENSKRRLSDHLYSSTSPVNNVMNETFRNLQFQHVDSSAVNLEKRFSTAEKADEERATIAIMNGDSSGTQEVLTQGKTVFIEDRESSDHLSNLIHSEDKQIEMTAATPSHAQLTTPGRINHFLLSNNPMRGALGGSVSDTSSVEITLNHTKDQVTNDSLMFISPPVKSLDQKPSSREEILGSFSGNLEQEVLNRSFVDPGFDGKSLDCASSGNHLTDRVDNLDSSVEPSKKSNSPIFEINHHTDHNQVKEVDDGDIYASALRKASEVVKNLQTANDPSLAQGELVGEEVKASACVPDSPNVRKTITEPSVSKSPSKEYPTWNPSRKEQGDSSVGARTDFNRSELSSKSNSDEHGNDDCYQGLHSQNAFAAQDFANSYTRKRRIEDIVLGDAYNASTTNLTQRNPKLHKSEGTHLESMKEQSDGIKKGNNKTGGDATLKHWTDISLRFSAEMNQIFSPSIEKLNAEAIGILEDILARLLKVYTYETLCSEILSQRTNDWSCNIKHKRVAETRLLLYKISYRKAMLQISRMKHERLLKRGQLLDSGIQKFKTLKSINAKHLSPLIVRDAYVDDNPRDSSLVDSRRKHEVGSDNETRMRQEVECLDKKTKNLIDSFHTYCKMKDELSCGDTIKLLNENLKRRMSCRTMSQDLQLWEISVLEKDNSKHSLVLNYCGFICQRFTKIANPVSSMVISNKVNDLKVAKNFPNMDACVAFAFLFNAEYTKRSVGSKGLARETQKTSSLLQNILAVVEEVQLARIDNRNMIHVCFTSPSAVQLDLHLSFIDFNNLRKVTVTLELTCLSCGVYPSDILPYRLEVTSARKQKSPPEALSAEINSAISNIAVGYMRIFRLCRCVSQVLQLSS